MTVFGTSTSDALLFFGAESLRTVPAIQPGRTRPFLAREQEARGRKWIRPNRRKNASDATVRYRIWEGLSVFHMPYSHLPRSVPTIH
jgi:hypothetical protein